MTIIRTLFVCAFQLALGIALAANAPTSNTLPSGEAVENFLMRQVGGGYAELTTDTQKKKPLQLLMEEIVLADGRDKAPGKWIDDIPDTQPPVKPDIVPRLSTASLYTDFKAANAHWKYFLQRYPVTGGYIEDNLKQISFTSSTLPGRDLDAYIKNLRSLNRYPQGKDNNLRRMGEGIVYVDFLFARGSEQTKLQAYWLLEEISENIVHNYKDKGFARIVMSEFAWPMMEPGTKRYSERMREYLSDSVLSSKKDYYRVQKWMINHTPSEEDMSGQTITTETWRIFKQAFPLLNLDLATMNPALHISKKTSMLIARQMAYETAKDLAGAVMCQMVAFPLQNWRM